MGAGIPLAMAEEGCGESGKGWGGEWDLQSMDFDQPDR
jgi:hypothetical protein